MLRKKWYTLTIREAQVVRGCTKIENHWASELAVVKFKKICIGLYILFVGFT